MDIPTMTMLATGAILAVRRCERGTIVGMPPPRPIRPRRDTSVDTNLIYDIHKAYPLNRPPNEELDTIIRPSFDNLLENFMLALGTLLLTRWRNLGVFFAGIYDTLIQENEPTIPSGKS